MIESIIFGGVVLGFISVLTVFGLVVENFGWIEEEKEKFDSEFSPKNTMCCDVRVDLRRTKSRNVFSELRQQPFLKYVQINFNRWSAEV